MTRKYSDFYYSEGKETEYAVAVPTPRQLQATTKLKDRYGCDVKIVITNFSGKYRGESYSAALFRKDRNASVFACENGWDYENRANECNIKQSKDRKEIVSLVGDLLNYHY